MASGGIDDVFIHDEEIIKEILLSVDGFHPLAEILQFSGSIDSPDECAHRATCYGTNTVSLGLEFLYGTYMG